MPLVNINVWQGMPNDQIDQIHEAVHACLVKAWGIPEKWLMAHAVQRTCGGLIDQRSLQITKWHCSVTAERMQTASPIVIEELSWATRQAGNQA